MFNNQYIKANLYSRLGISGTWYLAFRDIPKLIKKYKKGNLALDFGCGTGRSSRFLKSLDLIVDAVDISQEMIHKACQIDQSIHYSIITQNKIPQKSNFYDVVFSSLVLFEISSVDELVKIFKEVHRVLKYNGVFIILTGSTEMYNHQWLSLDVNYKENENLTSGALAKIRLKEVDLELYDYYWTDADYKHIITLSKFSLLEQISPLGKPEDKYDWLSEKNVSPYIIYAIQKNY